MGSIHVDNIYIYDNVPLEWEIFQTKAAEKIRKHILCWVIFFFPPENYAIYEIMWKNVVEPERPQITIWHMPFPSWITKATYTHSEYVVHIALPRQQ
jgi:hypothetical protein